MQSKSHSETEPRRSAVQGMDLVIDLPNCWEVEHCPDEVMENCPAYPNKGRECWKLTGTKCAAGRLETATLEQKIIHCRNRCSYYRNYIKKLYP